MADADVQQRALNIVIQQLLATREDDYKLYGVAAKEFATDAKGTLALHNTCKQLASHDASEYYNDILFCYHENVSESSMANPGEWRGSSGHF